MQPSFFRSVLVASALLGLGSAGCSKNDASGTAAPGGGSVPATVVLPLDYGGDVTPTAVQAECELDHKMPTWVAEYAPGATPAATAEGANRVLAMRVTNMMGASGGLWTGPKQMTVEGELQENGQVVGTFKARRTTTGGAFGGYKGTCSLLGRTAKAIAKDVSAWLAAPSMDARLGEM